MFAVEFQFTHPGRGATGLSLFYELQDDVSIHAPREGCDRVAERIYSVSSRFNSRTPGGVRLKQMTPLEVQLLFQFTHPGRGATRQVHETIR